MAYLQHKALTHSQKVLRLYKAAVRTIEDHAFERITSRYYAVLLRQRFEENRDIKDMIEAKRLLSAGEAELENKRHYNPKKFTFSPGGVAHEREAHIPDWVLDYWHPLEKAQYPHYFARREQRKTEYVDYWEKRFGKPNPEASEATK